MTVFLNSAEELSDEDFLKCFEDLSLDEKLFNHAQHVRLGWLYLNQESDFDRAMDRLRAGILRFASYYGARGKYHETITKFYLIVIDKFREEGETWLEFRDRNERLINNAAPMIFTHFSEKLIATDKARTEWVEPDREGIS